MSAQTKARVSARMNACPRAVDSLAGRRWQPPRPGACLQLDARRTPLHRLRQPYVQGRHPYDPGLVLIVASDREIRRSRLRRLSGAVLAAAATAALALLSLQSRSADDAVFAANLAPSAALYGLSEQLEVHPIEAPASVPPRPLALRLERALRAPADRGY